MLFAEPVLESGRAVGVDDALTFYAGGRGGVLGTSSWEQVHSAFAFFPPEIVQGAWETVTAWGDPGAMAGHYADGLTAFSNAVFPAEAAATFATVGQKVIDSITPLGYPLFVGWRAMERPSEVSSAAGIVMMTLRELRGDLHIQDIAAAGISPLEAEVVARGLDGISLHGWQPPYPDPDAHRSKVTAATAHTTSRMRSIYQATLAEHEWQSFTEALAVLASALRQSTTDA